MEFEDLYYWGDYPEDAGLWEYYDEAIKKQLFDSPFVYDQKFTETLMYIYSLPSKGKIQ